ncbi:thiol:disulfide interchange protein DsbA/DsbL [Propionivibrio limicola]|uniref:thiol:disulfide interchange protein DsbA/DsbL n=1 Tax=Propionivibrio limicola TaxID=167645 RepID=UPI001FEBC603|nr:thiol:disulfide interchange protein DsbA/DsbL [Propionivibrio limicola]
MMKNTVIGWLAAVTLALFGMALSAQAQQLAVGRDYAAIEPALTTDDPSRIEVLEFFSYGCPHCSELHPLLVKWAAKQPADVAFRRVPVGFGNPYYQLMARLYYSLEAIGELMRLDDAVFHAIQVKGLRLVDEKSVTEWVKAQGVDARKFSEAFNSFGVVSKARRGDQLAQAAKIRGVPSLVIDGRYLVVGQGVKSHAELLALADKVIDKARAERKLKKK